jgi:hypothetical protein
MTRRWTVRDDNGRWLPQFESNSQLEVARKIVPVHFDAFAVSFTETLPRREVPPIGAAATHPVSD